MAIAVQAGGQDLFTFSYWMLTVLHGLHVVGGLVPLVVASVRAGTGRYGSLNTVPIHNIALYWHFLGVTWAAILAVLLV
jgi:heme/copper-type cytochrome/quinol oxidase subunit 3